MRPRLVTDRSTTRTPHLAGRLATMSVVLAAVVLAVVVLAACGSDSDTSPGSSSTTTTTEKAAGGSSTAVVKTADVASVGTILVDADGSALYTLTADGAAVACTGGCLTAWPPLLLPAGTTTATGTDDVTELGTTATDGGEQVTHADLPLYTFAGDTAAGQANGEGISSFGGTWHVVKIGAATSESSNSSTTTTSSSGY
jgi:predicted lipoprotein with Yx(FWY)xxD motif